MRRNGIAGLQRWQIVALAGALLLMLATVLGSAAPASAQGGDRVEVFIGFERAPGAAEQALVRGAGGEVLHSYTIVPAIAATLPQGAVAALARNPRVTYVEPVTLAYALDHPTGDAELDRGWGVAHIGSGIVHAAGNHGTGVGIAVIDTGISNTHPDLSVVGGRNFLDNSDNWVDDNGHGTHVAGSACAVANGFGVVGVAADCELYALKVLNASGSGSWSGIVAAVEWAATHGIQVANLSLGSRGHPGITAEQAFANAYAGGLVIVAAAGNAGNCGGNNDSVEYPGRFASVIAVAATNANDVRPCFSSTGSAVELAAPGVSVMSTWPGATSGTNPQPVRLCDSEGSNCAYYKQGSGTSMSAPHVAGVAALVLAAKPDLSNADVRQVLVDSAIHIGPSHQYGAGLVSASRAVGAEAPPPPSTGRISGVVRDAATAAAIGGATVTVDTGQTATTATDGSYTVEGVAVGDRSVVASAPGYESLTQPVTVSSDEESTLDFALQPAPTEPPVEGNVQVTAVAYSAHGGPSSNRHLRVTVTLADGSGGVVPGAAVAIILTKQGGGTWSSTGTTGSDGAATFSFSNVMGGCFETEVIAVAAGGLEWDGVTPSNGVCT
jgi:subtilisin